MSAAFCDPCAFLLVRAGRTLCALPLGYVIETMRPLPIEPLCGLPSFVRGVSVIRGVPTPVVDLAMLCGLGDGDNVTRFVTVRLGERCVAVAVGAVFGVRMLERSQWSELQPLLAHAGQDVVDALGTLDAQLLLVLKSTWSVPERLWEVLETRGG